VQSAFVQISLSGQWPENSITTHFGDFQVRSRFFSSELSKLPRYRRIENLITRHYTSKGRWCWQSHNTVVKMAWEFGRCEKT
jgi:hypothetical protein